MCNYVKNIYHSYINRLCILLLFDGIFHKYQLMVLFRSTVFLMIFCLLDLTIIEVNHSTLLVDLSISSFKSISYYIMYFDTHYMHMHLGLLCHGEFILSLCGVLFYSRQFSCSEVCFV